MTQLDLAFIYHTFNTTLPHDNVPVRRVVIDSRDICPGDVFVAIKGEHFDGHDFVDDVLAKGAALCLVSRADCIGKTHCLNVGDTAKALGTLAKAWRLAVNPALVVFGITGSAGKTTVKEMLAAIVRAAAGKEAVLATAGNFNNHIGLPLTLLKLKPQHRFAVIEMGMSHFGELAYLTRLACPDFALVNNALRAHVGCGFDGVDDIARAKSEIYQGLGEQGTGFVPADDEHAAVFQAALQGRRMRTFGIDQGEVHAAHIVLHPLSVQFDLCTPSATLPITLPVPGRHMVHNAVGAAAMALAAGVSADAVTQGLAHFVNAAGRLQQKQSRQGAVVIDDTYNANPDSFRAAIDVLAAFAAPRVLVMGAIGELGDDAPAMHAEVGAYARARGIEHALFIGEHTDCAAKAYGAPEAFFHDKSTLIAALSVFDHAGATILVKGSHFMRMQEVVAALVDAGMGD